MGKKKSRGRSVQLDDEVMSSVGEKPRSLSAQA